MSCPKSAGAGNYPKLPCSQRLAVSVNSCVLLVGPGGCPYNEGPTIIKAPDVGRAPTSVFLSFA